MESQTAANNARNVLSGNSVYVSRVDQLTLKEKIEPILQKITDEEKKKAVSEFWYTHFAEYVGVLASTDFLIEKGELSPVDVYEKIFNNSNDIVNKGDKLEEYINDKKIMKEIKDTFRELCGYWVYKSKIARYAYEKPQGYPGDYQIIEKIYSNNAESSGIGYCFDKSFLENNYSRAVRGRKEKMKKLLHDFLISNHSGKKILNIACGSSREITELLTEHNYNGSKGIAFNLVDHDIKALFYSEKNLRDFQSNIKYNFFKNNVLYYLKNPLKYYDYLKGQDLIYSLGLLDYLPDRIIKELIVFLFSLLNSKGKLILAHPNSKTHKPLEADWFVNWNLLSRNQNELIEMVHNSGIAGYSLQIIEESETRIIFFMIIEKMI